MRFSDVSDNKTSRARGGSLQVKNMKIAGLNPNPQGISEREISVRAEKMAGWSEKRGIGEYCTLLVLLLVTSLFPLAFAQSMSFEKEPEWFKGSITQIISTELDSKFTPVQETLTQVEARLDTQESRIDEISQRLEKVEKKPAESKTPDKTYAAMAAVIAKGPSPVRDQEGLTKAIEAEEKKKPVPARANRFRDPDYAARMAANPEQRLDYDEQWQTGYCTIGFYPNGTTSDRERVKDQLMAKNGGREPAMEEIEWGCIVEFMVQDMGMPDDAIKFVQDLLDPKRKWFFQGDTSFIQCTSRDGPSQIYMWAPCMNKMAAHRRVVRKLHLWVPPQLESRFFQLKNLEFTYRQAKKKLRITVNTRIFYRGNTIYPQYKKPDENEWHDIPEPASAKIPGVEFWRRTAHPRLNSRPSGAPIAMPALPDVNMPPGRERKDEAKFSSRGRGGGRGRGGFVRGGARGGKGTGAGTETTQVTVNTKAAFGNGQDSAESSGSGVIIKAGRSIRRWTPKRLQSSSSNSIRKYLEIDTAPRSKSMSEAYSKRDREDSDDECEENKCRRIEDTEEAIEGVKKLSPELAKKVLTSIVTNSVRKDEESKKKAQLPSPTKQEMQVYQAIAKKLHKEGEIQVINAGKGGSLAQARVSEKQKLNDLMEKEGKWYEERIARVNDGDDDYTKQQLDIDAAMFKSDKLKHLANLALLGDRTLETTLLDSSLDSLDSTDVDTTVETSDDEAFVTEGE